MRATVCASLVVTGLLFSLVEVEGRLCSAQTGPTSFEDVDCGESDCLVAQYELLFDNSARCTPLGCNDGGNGMVMSTAGTNVLYKVCTSAVPRPGRDLAACNAGVDMYDSCEGGTFTLREGSPTFIYEDGTNPGGGAPVESGGGAEGPGAEVDDTADDEAAAVPDYPRCEAFDPSNEEVAMCAPFIQAGAMVYVPAGESQGELLTKMLGLSVILDSLPFMNSKCQATFGSFWCRARMRGCETVTTIDGETSFPVAQLTCRADCDAHKADCLADYEAIFPESYLGGIAVARGETVTSPQCDMPLEQSSTNTDAEVTWFMYRHGGEVTYEGTFPLFDTAVDPKISAGQDLYPAEHIVYDDGSEDGHVVSCLPLSPTAGPTTSPTQTPTEPKRELALQFAVVVDEALEETKKTEMCAAVENTASETMEVEKRYIACNIEEQGEGGRRRLLAVSYDLSLSISIPADSPVTDKNVVLALAAEIEDIPELAELGASIEVVSYSEEGEGGEPAMVISLISTASKTVPSFLAVLYALAFVLD